MLGGEARDRIAGFWRALGLVPPPEPDHLAVMLGLYAGQPGARAWRRYISEHAHRPGAGSEVLVEALNAMPAVGGAATMHGPDTNTKATLP